MSRSSTVVARSLIVLPLVAGIALAQPVSAAHTPTHHSAGKTYTVKMQPGKSGTYVFSPAKLVIQPGDTVKWVDANSTPHDIIGQGSASKLIKRTAINTSSYAVTFKTPGTYNYECTIHLPTMKGQIIVANVVKMQPGKSGTYVFNPAKLTIHAGDTVLWVDTNSTPHDILGVGSASKLIKRTAINTSSYAVTFKTPGTYNYECSIHLPTMKGQIIVKK